MINVRDDIQKQVLQMVFKGTNSILKPEEQGQTELKSVYSLLEKRLKNIDPESAKQNQETQQSISNKKVLKPIVQRPFLKTTDDHVQEEQLKKKRVDKNKCRVCGDSTIPQILDLINEERGFVLGNDSDVTMRKIRENLLLKKGDFQKQTDINKQQKVPYIALNYSQKIAICKRCRFKFHSKCLEDRDTEFVKMQENWICNFCDDKIKELQSLDLWDYENKKKKKKEEVKPPLQPTNSSVQLINPQNPINNNSEFIKKRIGENKKIFKIIHAPNQKKIELTQEQKKDKFLLEYPLYKKNENDEIDYPIYDEKDKFKAYGPIEFKQKPQYSRIQNEQFSKIFEISSVMSLLPIKLDSIPLIQNGVDISPSILFSHLLVFLSLIYDEVISDKRFDFYQRVCCADNSAFFQILKFNHTQLQSHDQFNKIIIKTWSLFCQQAMVFFQGNSFYRARQNVREQYIIQTESQYTNELIQAIAPDEEEENISYKKKLQINEDLTISEIIELTHFIQKGLYDLETFGNIMADRENINFEQKCQQSDKTLFYIDNPKLLINQNLCLGQDQENRIYYWTRLAQNMIIVKDQNQWGYYVGETINDLLDCLEVQGIRENLLLQNIENLKSYKIIQLKQTELHKSTQIFDMEQTHVSLNEVSEILLQCESQIQQFLQTRYCRWAKKDIRQQFVEKLSRVENPLQIHDQLKIFIEGLLAIEKIEHHPKNKNMQDPNEQFDPNNLIIDQKSDEDDLSSSYPLSIHQQSYQQQSSSLNLKDDGARSTRTRLNLQKALNSVAPEHKEKTRQPLPPFDELENSEHGSRRTQTKIFFFNSQLKVPLLHLFSTINIQDIQSLYLIVFTLNLLIKDYLIKKQQQRLETKEKRKRGRKSKNIEENINLTQDIEHETPQGLNQEFTVSSKNEMFEYLVRVFESPQQRQSDLMVDHEQQDIDKDKPQNKIETQPKVNAVQIDSLANRREKRGNAGKNPKMMELDQPDTHKKYCSKCTKTLEHETICQKCNRSFHLECMNGVVCKLCKIQTPAVIAMSYKSKRSGQQIFMDE